jgi:adenosylmethionine-8-amino-7-oxononanoate aminotransferase
MLSKRVHQAIEHAAMDEKFMHAATYSGHPVCCAVGSRNIDMLEQEDMPERTAVISKRSSTDRNRCAVCQRSVTCVGWV